MSEAVLDASAVLAMLYQERGAEEVADMLSDGDAIAMISAVNFCEVLTRLMRDGIREEDAINTAYGIEARDTGLC